MDRETRLKIIAVLKAHPALWDKSSVEFIRFQRRINSKTETWISVAKGLSEVGVKINMDRLRTDWTHLRLTFLKFANPEQRKKTNTDYELMLHEKLLALASSLMDMSENPSQPFTQRKVEVKATDMNSSQQNESIISKLEETIPPQFVCNTASPVEDTTTLIESTVPPTQPPIVCTERSNVSAASIAPCNPSTPVESVAQPNLEKELLGVSLPPPPNHDSSEDSESDSCENTQVFHSPVSTRAQTRKRKAEESGAYISKISRAQNSVAVQTECPERPANRLSLTDRQLRALHITIAPTGAGQWRRTTTVIRELRTFSQMVEQTVDNSTGTQYDNVAESVPQIFERSVLNPTSNPFPTIPRHQMQSSSFVPPFSYNPHMFEPSQFLASMQMMMGSSSFGSANQAAFSKQAGTVYDTVATQRPPVPMHRNPSLSKN